MEGRRVGRQWCGRGPGPARGRVEEGARGAGGVYGAVVAVGGARCRREGAPACVCRLGRGLCTRTLGGYEL